QARERERLEAEVAARTRELAVALGELAGARGHFRLEAFALTGLMSALELLLAKAMSQQAHHRQDVDRVGPGRFPRRRITMQCDREWRAPHGIGADAPDFEHVIARGKVGERDPVLSAKVDPTVGQ